MTKRDFETLISAYGASPERWPYDRRDEAQIYLNTHPEAQKALEIEAKLDVALDSTQLAEPSELLRARIMKAATGRVTEPVKTKPARPAWRALAASLVAVLTIGFIGLNVVNSPMETTSEETIWLEAANDLGVSDIYTWVEDEQ